MNTKTQECLILSITPHFSKVKFKNALNANIDIREIITHPGNFKKHFLLVMQ